MSSANGIEVILKKSAYKKRICTYSYKNIDFIDLLPFLKESQHVFIQKTKTLLSEKKCVKSFLILEAKFTRTLSAKNENESNGSEQFATFYLQSKVNEINLSTNLKNWFKTNVADVIMTKVDDLQGNGSGWTLHEIISLDVSYNKFIKFSGASFMELPKSIKNKRAIVNIQNTDNQCFKWAILSALHPVNSNTNRLSQYERFKNDLDFTGIKFPMKLSDICIFEQLNPDISINVYIIQKEYSTFTERYEDVTVPVRLTEIIKSNHIHLLLLFEYQEDQAIYERDSKDELCPTNLMELIDDSTNTHYVWIKNLSALVQNQVTKKIVQRNIYVIDVYTIFILMIS